MEIKAYLDRLRRLMGLPARGETEEEESKIIAAVMGIPWLQDETMALIYSWSIPCAMTVYVCKVIAGESEQSHATRGPPKSFIPIPKIETGGCARSDSLVRSLIF
ncbi:MAG: hypothetical protein EAZ60_00890 [Oscillatoriales cyanobacterium]|nr:MAG: hypothetical protein EAZ83_06625 [Oscillatoriales cyanobacterium]TAE95744.1 MAG: hypothetical protein EAZ79_17790 [Oscillatoriales cyanobacterium]TAF22307.1 MAG: hypothetical protein EAZ73_06330 [Oscillatoriales cyanobacterium]TAF39187.1 MAG: hypothetical protein EAZ69_01685 [Oscillatoriales cyanobacterium]TAF58952.1 MAG: hypothetical protein EAZ60_00890 [Oscillatoriales cyanobacterium]